jgi:hypothetical protein
VCLAWVSRHSPAASCTASHAARISPGKARLHVEFGYLDHTGCPDGVLTDASSRRLRLVT